MATTPTSSAVAAPRAQRVPPQDIDAEMALLGAMMMSRDVVARIVPIIGRSDSAWLYRPDHRRLFEVLIDLYDDPTKAIDAVVVADELRRRDLLDAVGGMNYLVQLAESFADVTNAEHYARITRDKGMLRDLIRVSGEIAEAAYDATEDPHDILDQAEQAILEATERRISGQAVPLREAVVRIKEHYLEHDGTSIVGLPSGFHVLDEMTTGFHPGDFVVIAGRPSMGKTALGLTMAHHIACGEGRAVGFFSMEMSADQLALRLLAAHARYDAQRLRKRKVPEADLPYLLEAASELADAPFYVDDTPGMTSLELRAKVRRLKQRHDVQIIFVDYLQLMHVPGGENRQVEIATISRQLKALGRELAIPVVALAQLNRKSEDRKNARPMMSDLRESGAIEQDADVVLLIHRPEYYEADPEKRDLIKGEAELIVAKQRNGPTGEVPLTFHKEYTIFTPQAHVDEPPAQSYDQNAPF